MPRGFDKGRARSGDTIKVWHAWRLRLVVAALPILAVVLVDLLLRAGGWLPPGDPLVLYARSYEAAFDPFSKTGDGHLTIKAGWVNEGEIFGFVQGEREGQTFLLPAFRPTRFARDKPADTLRVFALGGSTTFGVGAGAAHSFSEQLRTRLAAAFPGQTVEVVNLGCPGWATDRILGLVPRLIELSPDLLVVYSGHNETLRGDSGPATGTGLLSHVGASSLRWSSVIAWLHHGVSSWRDRKRVGVMDEEDVNAALDGTTPAFNPMQVPEERRRLPEPAFLAASEARYTENLRAMVRQGRSAGVPVLFVLPVANLQYPPHFSVHRDDIDERLFQQLLDRAQGAFREGRLEEALDVIEEAIEMSPDYAMTHYWSGAVLNSLGRTGEARQAFHKAVDRDVWTIRITSGLESAFMEAMETENGRWIDLRPIFHRSLDPASVRTLFVDHLHPTRFGHQLIADALLPQARAALAERHAEAQR